MAGVTVGYKGTTVATLTAKGTKTMQTGGKVCEGDITVTYQPPTVSELVSGSLDIKKNGTYDVASYAKAAVNVPVSELVSGSLAITENGTYDVTAYAQAVVDVKGGGGAETLVAAIYNNTSADGNVPVTLIAGNNLIKQHYADDDAFALVVKLEPLQVNGQTFFVNTNRDYGVTASGGTTHVYGAWLANSADVVNVPSRMTSALKTEATAVGHMYATADGDLIVRAGGNNNAFQTGTYFVLFGLMQEASSGGGGSVEPENPLDAYQRVEYITAAEEETYPYLITDVCADNDIGVEIVASFPIMQDRIPMGSRENSDATRFYCVYPLSTSNVYYGFNTGSTVSCPLKVNTVYRLQTNFLNSRLVNVYDEDGERKGSASLSATLTPHTVPMSIFGYHSAASGSVTSKREYLLYGARISRKNEVIRDYYPCYRKSDGVVGLLDKVTMQFLTNADTDGGSAFATGAEIGWEE